MSIVFQNFILKKLILYFLIIYLWVHIFISFHIKLSMKLCRVERLKKRFLVKCIILSIYSIFLFCQCINFCVKTVHHFFSQNNRLKVSIYPICLCSPFVKNLTVKYIWSGQTQKNNWTDGIIRLLTAIVGRGWNRIWCRDSLDDTMLHQ